MDEILMQSVIEKVDGHEKRISETQMAINKMSDVSEQIESLKGAVDKLNSSVDNISFPVREMKDLRSQLSRPVTNTVEHHHHFPKILWLAIGLFLALAVVCTGWYMTATAVKEYKANDTKYRYLRLNSNRSLQGLLFFTDSLYRVDQGMRDSVIQKEEENRRVFELLQKAKDKEEEAEELKRKAGN